MAEFREKAWRCDFCKRKVHSPVMPKSWTSATDYYGNETHACQDDACKGQLRAFAKIVGMEHQDAHGNFREME